MSDIWQDIKDEVNAQLDAAGIDDKLREDIKEHVDNKLLELGILDEESKKKAAKEIWSEVIKTHVLTSSERNNI